jgi:hypothetical protein
MNFLDATCWPMWAKLGVEGRLPVSLGWRTRAERRVGRLLRQIEKSGVGDAVAGEDLNLSAPASATTSLEMAKAGGGSLGGRRKAKAPVRGRGCKRARVFARVVDSHVGRRGKFSYHLPTSY